MSRNEDLFKRVTKLYQITLATLGIFLVFGVVSILYVHNPSLFSFNSEVEVVAEKVDDNLIENGVHVKTGLVDGEGLMLVVNNCTRCHSAKIVTQNRMNEERWNATIKWMQETQGLWDLGDNQEIIVNYLVTNYPVPNKGRRENLKNINWYELEN